MNCRKAPSGVRKWQPTPVIRPGRSQGQRSLAGYNPWGHRELDSTQRLSKDNNLVKSEGEIRTQVPITVYPASLILYISFPLHCSHLKRFSYLKQTQNVTYCRNTTLSNAQSIRRLLPFGAGLLPSCDRGVYKANTPWSIGGAPMITEREHNFNSPQEQSLRRGEVARSKSSLRHLLLKSEC